MVIRDVLGPTDTKWERPYEYDVAWDLFLSVFEAQGSDGVAVFPPGAAPDTVTVSAPAAAEPDAAPNPIQPSEPVQVCC